MMDTTPLEVLKESIFHLLRAGHDLPAGDPVPFRIGPSPERKFGHFSTNVAMAYAKVLKTPPRQIALSLVKGLEALPDIESVSIEGAGFINMLLKPSYFQERVLRILQGEYTANFSLFPPDPIQIEFVSANPTGPLTIGHGRQAVLGDVLSSVFQKAGAALTREYYFNDAGKQMKLLSRSLWVRYNRLCGSEYEIPEGGYHGEYLSGIAEGLYREKGDAYRDRWDDSIEALFTERAKNEIFQMIKRTLESIGIRFDVYYTEGSLFRDGTVDEVLRQLRDREALYEKDQALWFKTSDFEEDQDKVLIRSDGMPTYFLTDIAYHYAKYRRGFSKVYDIWGADHHGHIARMNAAMRALGIPEGFFNVILHQMVSLRQNEEIVKMSKRSAHFVSLDELVQKVGKDAVRYFFAMVDKDSQFEFNIDLALSRSMDNPVYYVQYAVARIHSLFENARNKGLLFAEFQNINRLDSEDETFLIRDLLLFPEIIREICATQQIHRLTNYLYGLAYAFHNYYTGHVFVDLKQPELSNARLNLASACQKTIAEGLKLLGVSAPERM
ncbi:MAG TPA: arginine--tRNA ligase [Thermotogota bacterium]|jgi:arginyl-tRNA synthetase|nr:arginine--tRNA ligase [Thermotogota bacterium]HPV94485.1 arginine--tRNA ligase [Thermotogota bacterium]HPY46548.1 arginine--tRNA ligase [Thermotogota bacterium]